MEYKDYYKTLGVERTADLDTIKKSYRRLARKYHPDVSKEANAEARFKEIAEAYEVLKDSEKRQAYDQLGSNWKNGQHFRPPPNWGGASADSGFSSSGYTDLGDLFESLFGTGRRAGAGGAAPKKGDDQQITLTIDLEDALKGAKRNITLRSSGGMRGDNVRTLTVNIPKGIKAGQKIRLSGQGGSGTAGAGDLLLEVAFNPHRLFTVDGGDLQLKLPITPWEAALGTTLTVPLPAGGSAEIKIPANSKSGRKMRLKGKGIPSNPAGDLYLLLDIVLPEANSDVAKTFYQQMARELYFNPRANW